MTVGYLEQRLASVRNALEWAGKSGVIPRQAEPEREKCHWDFLLAEMVGAWLGGY